MTAAGACTGPAACGGEPPPVTASLTRTTPDCIRGMPPAAAAMEYTDPKTQRAVGWMHVYATTPTG